MNPTGPDWGLSRFSLEVARGDPGRALADADAPDHWLAGAACVRAVARRDRGNEHLVLAGQTPRRPPVEAVTTVEAAPRDGGADHARRAAGQVADAAQEALERKASTSTLTSDAALTHGSHSGARPRIPSHTTSRCGSRPGELSGAGERERGLGGRLLHDRRERHELPAEVQVGVHASTPADPELGLTQHRSSKSCQYSSGLVTSVVKPPTPIVRVSHHTDRFPLAAASRPIVDTNTTTMSAASISAYVSSGSSGGTSRTLGGRRERVLDDVGHVHAIAGPRDGTRRDATGSRTPFPDARSATRTVSVTQATTESNPTVDAVTEVSHETFVSTATTDSSSLVVSAAAGVVVLRDAHSPPGAARKWSSRSASSSSRRDRSLFSSQSPAMSWSQARPSENNNVPAFGPIS